MDDFIAVYFCVGIRQLQCVLLKVALLFGVEVHESVAFEDLIPPPEDQSISKILSLLIPCLRK